MAKNGWLNLVGTMFSSFRLGFTGVRIKDVSGVLQVRNSGDTADANLKSSGLQLSGVGASAGDIAGFDASGNIVKVGASGGSSGVLPDNIMIDAVQFHLVAGVGINIGVSSTYHNNHAAANITPANGDSWNVSFSCADGTYLIRIIGSTNTNAPKMDIFIDGVLLANVDWYSASGVVNVQKSTSTGALTAGKHVLTLTVNGKNASSSGFQLAINYILLNT